MKRKQSSSNSSLVKHFKAEPFLLDENITEFIAKFLENPDFGALMGVSKYFFQGMKSQRVTRVLPLDSSTPADSLCIAYRAAKDGIVSWKQVKTWCRGYFAQAHALNDYGLYYIAKALFGDAVAIIPPTWRAATTPWDVLLKRQVDIERIPIIMQYAWTCYMHEDEVVQLVVEIVHQHPSTNIQDLLLLTLAMWKWSPESIADVKQKCVAIKLGLFLSTPQCNFDYLGKHPNVKCLSKTPEFLFNFLRTKSPLSFKSIANCTDCMSYLVKRYSDKVIQLVGYVSAPIPKNFPYTPDQIETYMLRMSVPGQCHRNPHVWNYILAAPTKRLAKILLSDRNMDVLQAIDVERLFAVFAVNKTKTKTTGNAEPGPLDLATTLLRRHMNNPDFVDHFLAHFDGMDYRRLVISIWRHTQPPSRLLQLQLPCAFTDPGLVLYYETLRLKLGE